MGSDIPTDHESFLRNSKVQWQKQLNKKLKKILSNTDNAYNYVPFVRGADAYDVQGLFEKDDDYFFKNVKLFLKKYDDPFYRNSVYESSSTDKCQNDIIFMDENDYAVLEELEKLVEECG